MAKINGAAARLKDTGRTRPVISASTIVAPSRWRAVSPLGLRCHGPNGSKPVTSTFIKVSYCKTVLRNSLFNRLYRILGGLDKVTGQGQAIAPTMDDVAAYA